MVSKCPLELLMAKGNLGQRLVVQLIYHVIYVGVQMMKMWSVHQNCWYPKASWQIYVESPPN